MGQGIKILHLFDMAGIAPQICYYYTKITTNKAQNFLIRRKSTNKIIDRFNANVICYDRVREVLKMARKHSRYYDIIHVHSNDIFIPFLKLLGKKIVLQYHGSDINLKSRQNNLFRILCRSMANVILYNSQDMKKKIKTIGRVKKIYFPNFVDIELFKSNGVDHNSNALLFVSSNLDKKKTKAKANLVSKTSIDIIDLDERRIKYTDMPLLLSKYEYYIDEKITDFGEYLTQFSTTGLQALACGVKVIHQGLVYNELPQDRTPEFAMKKLQSIYEDIL